jgi:hypothetical protein
VFFSSYETILVAEARVAQQSGATSFCRGTEIDQLTGPAYQSDWTDIINSVRAVFTGKLWPRELDFSPKQAAPFAHPGGIDPCQPEALPHRRGDRVVDRDAQFFLQRRHQWR